MTSSIRNEKPQTKQANGIACAIVLSACTIAGGCASHRPKVYEVSRPALTSEPMYVDAATQQRDWPLNVAYYANGSVQAFATRWAYEGQETDFAPLNGVLDPVLFLSQAVMLPVRIALEPPGTMVNYNGQVMQPT